MQLELTEPMRAALTVQEDRPLALIDPTTRVDYVLLSRGEYERLLEEAGEERFQRALLKASVKAQREWARENPY